MSRKSKIAVGSTVRLDAFAIVERAVGEGVEAGWRRAHKHTDKPSGAALQESIEREVMGALCEVLLFGEEE